MFDQLNLIQYWMNQDDIDRIYVVSQMNLNFEEYSS
jgi:hypothetical protein